MILFSETNMAPHGLMISTPNITFNTNLRVEFVATGVNNTGGGKGGLL